MNGMALCSGVGGLERALALVENHRTVLWCEWDKRAAATLVSNFGEGLDVAPIWDDLRSLDGKPWRGVVDLISAGFPCQPFSDAGNKRGEEDDRHLWPHVLRIVREVAPEYVFVENVPGIITTYAADGRPAAIVVREDLEELGFRVEEGLFSAEEVGAPHRRVRWFLVAHHNRHRPDGGGELPSGGIPEISGDRHSDRGATLAHDDRNGLAGKPQRRIHDRKRGNDPHGRDGELGDPLSPRRKTTRKRRNLDSGQKPQTGSRVLGDPTSIGRERGWSTDSAGRSRTNEPQHYGRELADLDSEGLEERDGVRPTGAIPWPPARDDDWNEYLERYPYAAPATESSVRGDPNGVASGMDVCVCSRRERLKQCGNGVVPATAALAWTTLKARIR